MPVIPQTLAIPVRTLLLPHSGTWDTERNTSVDSSTPKVLAHHGWYLPVGLLASLPLLEYYVTKIFPN